MPLIPAQTSLRKQKLAKTRALRIERSQRREDMLESIVSGAERGVVAARHRVSLKTVYREVNRALDQRRLDAPDRYVRLQVERLTRALQSIDRAIDGGDIDAVALLVKVMDKLDRYHGVGFAAVSFQSPDRAVTPLALTRDRSENGG